MARPVSARPTGARPAGTEGHDYVHRERVASQYTDSVLNKKRLKLNLGCHFAMVLLLALRVSPLMSLFARKSDDVPPAMQWEEVWLLSLIPSVLCFYAISRNHVAAMQASITMTLMFGCGPLFYGAFVMMDDAFIFFTANEEKIRAAPLFFGFPVVMIRFMFIALALQIHAFAVFLQFKLINAWNTRGAKSR